MKIGKYEIVKNQATVKPEVNTGTRFETHYIPQVRKQVDLDEYFAALKQAELMSDPKRDKLIELYNTSIDYDAHLQAVLNIRRESVLNRKMVFVNKKGKEIDELNELIDSPKFYEFLGDIFMTKPYGFTVIEFLNKEGSKEFNYGLIDRRHIDPIKHMIYKEKWGGAGYNWDKDKNAKFLMPIGKANDFGELCSVVPLCIRKRNGLNDYVSYVELAGHNFMMTKIIGNDPKIKNQAVNALNNVGAGGKVFLPEGVNIEFSNLSSTSQNQLFTDFHNLCNKEISKVLLGQTMTTEDGSSRSQAEVHERVQDLIFESDVRFIENVLNHQFIKYLYLFGYGEIKGKFKFVEDTSERDLQEMEKLTKLKALGLNFTPKYLAETFNIPIDAINDTLDPEQKETDSKNQLDGNNA